ncbi:ABC transporter substrate-binding protein [Fundicoccus ignavus]|uniref:ABC transporter substrate-binding protein n=1 Tax=Fundicoccus ignavus TaxID=2664442 RepID=A0A844C659_9LACT|nr:ABC transporter substrate-binding protein [Fundicoccus ignavus]MRJ45987.1 ABC transporter substrate-binding protein [Fundicoccus ignavus]
MNLRKFGVKLLAGLTLLSATAPTTAAFAQEDKEPILVGANYELSGYSASYGVALFEALELAVEQVNANGGLLDGRPVELVYADNQSDKTETVSVATKLIEDGVVAIVGPGATDVAMVQSQIIEDAGVPTLIPAATADHLTTNPEGDVYNYLFRLASTYTFQANAAARFAQDQFGATKAVVLVDQSNDYSVGQAGPFVEEFERLGGEIVREESYTGGETDFMGILTTLLAEDFDVIYLPAFYTEGGLITKQAREMGITQPILSGHGFASDTLVELAGAENATDLYYTSHFHTGSESPVVQEFIAAYEAKFGKKPDTFGALGYDAANLLFQAIEDAGSTDRDAVRDAIENTQQFDGVTGSFSFDDYHNAVKTAPMLHMVNGEIVDVFEVDGSTVTE